MSFLQLLQANVQAQNHFVPPPLSKYPSTHFLNVNDNSSPPSRPTTATTLNGLTPAPPDQTPPPTGQSDLSTATSLTNNFSTAMSSQKLNFASSNGVRPMTAPSISLSSTSLGRTVPDFGGLSNQTNGSGGQNGSNNSYHLNLHHQIPPTTTSTRLGSSSGIESSSSYHSSLPHYPPRNYSLPLPSLPSSSSDYYPFMYGYPPSSASSSRPSSAHSQHSSYNLPMIPSYHPLPRPLTSPAYPHSLPFGYGGVGLGMGYPAAAVNRSYNFIPLPSTGQPKKRARRRYDEIERIYSCGWEGCTKAYGTLNHLNAHVVMQGHGERRGPAEFKEIRKEWKARQKAKAASEAKESNGTKNGSLTSSSEGSTAIPPRTADSTISSPSKDFRPNTAGSSASPEEDLSTKLSNDPFAHLMSHHPSHAHSHLHHHLYPPTLPTQPSSDGFEHLFSSYHQSAPNGLGGLVRPGLATVGSGSMGGLGGGGRSEEDDNPFSFSVGDDGK